MNKQPQTCYVPTLTSERDNKLYVGGYEIFPQLIDVQKLDSVYIHTPEELEALKAKWMREAAEKAWVEAKSLSNLYLYEYLDQHYPLPQPINTNQ